MYIYISQVCELRNVRIVCDLTRNKQKRDLNGEVKEVDEVDLLVEVIATKIGNHAQDCDKICSMLHIPSDRCSESCLPSYKRFLQATMMYSKKQLNQVFSDSAQMLFTAAQREFEPLAQGVKTSDLISECDHGMMADGSICGRAYIQIDINYLINISSSYLFLLY